MKSIVKDYFFTKKVLINFLVLFVLSISQRGFAQNVTVTDDEGYTPDDAAMLDVKSDAKGLLVPRVALVTSTDPIGDPKPTGLLVWNTNTGDDYTSVGFYFWNGTDWELISSSSTFNFGNGLTESNGNVLFGGTLQQSTTLNQGNYNLDINLDGTGVFSVQDEGTEVFQILDDGTIKMYDNVVIEGSSTCKVFRNLVSYNFDPKTGAYVIQTNIPASPKSYVYFNLKIRGLIYDVYGPFELILSGRIYENSIYQEGYVNIGSMKLPVRIGRHKSTGYIVFIIGDETVNYNYTLLSVTDYIQANDQEESFAKGWRITNTPDLSSYVIMEENVPDMTDASGFWSINGSNVYLTDTSDNVGIGVMNPIGKLEIKGDASAAEDDPIFEVKNKYGQVVFGVYHEGVRIYVADEAGKGSKGGFAVGGFSLNKAPTNEYLRVTPDSVRIYIEEPTGKGRKGGFAVGGFSLNKVPTNEYLRVTTDSVRIYIEEPTGKGRKGGFAVGGFSMNKALTNEYLRVTTDSVRVYIKEPAVKGSKGGFAVGGFSLNKELSNSYLHVLPDSTRVYVDGDGGFAVDNIESGSEGRYVDLTPENYFIGHNSGEDITTGLYNSFYGYQSGMNNRSGSNNVFLGYQTGHNNVTGFSNIYIGNNAGTKLSNGLYNIYIGDSAGYNNTAFQVCNIFIGPLSGYNNSGSANTFIGSETGKLNTSGGYNTFLGNRAGWKNTNGGYNTFLGNGSGYNNSTGGSNVFIGFYSGSDNISGAYNTFIGNSSGHEILGSRNICIGYQAGYNETGSDKLYIESSNSASPLIYGEFDNDIVTINGDLGVGINPLADLHVLGDATSGRLLIAPDESVNGDDSELLLAEDADYTYGMSLKYDGGINYLEIFGKSGATSYGPHFRVGRDNGIIEMPAVYSTTVSGLDLYISSAGRLGVLTSSLRYKKEIEDMEAVDWLYKLRPVNFVYKNDSTHSKQYGLIAEEVEKVNPVFVSYAKDGRVETVRYSQFITPLLKALQEQQKQIETLEEKLSELEQLKQELNELKNQIK